MKNAIRFLGITILALFCCFAGKPSVSIPESTPSSGISHKEFSFSKFTKTSLFHTTPTEGYGENHSGGSFSGVKTPFNGFWAVLWAAERCYASAFVHYVRISRTFQIGLRKADIIFPFHYFW